MPCAGSCAHSMMPSPRPAPPSYPVGKTILRRSPTACPKIRLRLSAELEGLATTRSQRIGAIAAEFQHDAQTRAGLAGLEARIATARTELDVWAAVNLAAGSRNGDRFTRIAQSITLDVLVGHANHHLADLNPRYRLRRAADLALQVEDRDMGDEPRATRSLSGGERFLVSLALALALSRMGGKGAWPQPCSWTRALARSTQPVWIWPSTRWKPCNLKVGRLALSAMWRR